MPSKGRIGKILILPIRKGKITARTKNRKWAEALVRIFAWIVYSRSRFVALAELADKTRIGEDYEEVYGV